uniref:NADH-ubiquinone oxidoreductase chain 2 n=1 Tax=Odontotarsus purpureolineatus TaxID=1545339 RepID=A0A2K9YVG6_9HEMI|nr:NADH dehydrogenase subunit 2 [Odontotarsus purpureolineatus]
MLKSKSLFLIITMTGTILTLSSNNWISMWMGLEINMMAFIPLISDKNKNSSQSMMIYLLTQSMSSMILMFSILMYQATQMTLFNNMMLISLLIKMGAAPFHMWLPEIMTKMSWTSNAILMTWQKVAPMTMINSISYNNMIMYMTIIMSVIIGAVGGMNQMSMRKIMGYSSINHLGWMLSLSKIKNNWTIYLMIYSTMIVMLCWMFNQYNMIHINQVNSMNMTMMEKMNYFIAMMSLGGLPPFLGFMPKWIVIQTLIQSNLIAMMTVMVLFSLLSLYYYMRMMTNMMMNYSTVNKWNMTMSSSYMISIMMMLNMSLPLIMIMNLT